MKLIEWTDNGKMCIRDRGLTYTEGVGWQEKETKAESQVHSASKSTYYEAFCDARKALNSEQRTGGMNENIMSQDNFEMKA